LLSKAAFRIVSLFASLFVSSFIFANSILLYASFAPLFTLLIGILMDNPKSLEITRSGLRPSTWVGENLVISLHVKVGDGLGPVTIVDEIPSIFALIEGSNFKVLWKGRGSKSFSFSYKVRCTKRGSFMIPPVRWESRHILGLKESTSGQCGEEIELTVRPRIYNVRRLRGRYTTSIFPMPLSSIVKMGPSSTDFREIRNYVVGDPVKLINWKATAKRLTMLHRMPLVNEYEREGRQTVWILLNASRRVETGSEVENTFEYEITAGVTLLYYFLARGYRLGMYIYNNNRESFYPDTGMKQVYKLLRRLSALEAFDESENLEKVVERNRKFVVRYDPLCIVITCLNKEDAEGLKRGVKRLIALRRGRRHKPRILLVNILSQGMLPASGVYDENSRILLDMMNQSIVKALRTAGISVLEWDPRMESFSTVLLRQVKKR